MATLVISALLPALAAGVTDSSTALEKDYAAAFKQSLFSGRPLVVMLGAEWCPACVQMKESVLPQVVKAGGLEKIEFAYVDVDRQAKLAGRLAQADAIPQLIRFEKSDSGWKRDLLTGAHSVKEVTSFIKGEPKQAAEPSTWTAALIGWAKSIAGAN